MSWYTHWWDQQFGLNGRLPIVDALKALPSVGHGVWAGWRPANGSPAAPACC